MKGLKELFGNKLSVVALDGIARLLCRRLGASLAHRPWIRASPSSKGASSNGGDLSLTCRSRLAADDGRRSFAYG